jgi:hypothetical protein
VRVERVGPGRPPVAAGGPDGGATAPVLARDVVVGGERWAKGRRLSAADLAALASGGPTEGVSVVVPGPDELHEDEAALRLAHALVGGDPAAAGLILRGPSESRVDLIAAADGVATIDAGRLERVARIEPLGPFSILDGQAVAAGDLVASVKVAPHVVAAGIVDRGIEAARRGRGPAIRVAPYLRRRVAALVKGPVADGARARFEASVREKVECLGSTLVAVRYEPAEPAALERALRELVRGRDRADVILTAGAGSSDPADPLFLGLAAAGGRVLRHGVPAHPGSMIWLGRLGRTTLLGVPSCGAYSKATAVDLLLPWLLAGFPPNGRTVARLAHGGVLSRSMRFRFPAYARTLDAPERGPIAE